MTSLPWFADNYDNFLCFLCLVTSLSFTFTTRFGDAGALFDGGLIDQHILRHLLHVQVVFDSGREYSIRQHVSKDGESQW